MQPSRPRTRQRHRRRRRDVRGARCRHGEPHRARTVCCIDGANVVQFEALGGDADTEPVQYRCASATGTRRRQTTTSCRSGGCWRRRSPSPSSRARHPRVVDITDPKACSSCRDAWCRAATRSIVQTPGDGTRTLLAFTDRDDQDAALRRRESAIVAAREWTVARLLSSSHIRASRRRWRPSPRTAPRRATRRRSCRSTMSTTSSASAQRSPQALKDFLARARAAWTVAPRFVVLAGDATFDPRDYAGLGFGDFVPTALRRHGVRRSSRPRPTTGSSTATATACRSSRSAGCRCARRTQAASASSAKIIAYDAEAAGAWTTERDAGHRHRRPDGALPRVERGAGDACARGLQTQPPDRDVARRRRRCGRSSSASSTRDS